MNNSKISHFSWDNLVTQTFKLADSLGGKMISTGGNKTTVVYKTPAIEKETDTETILMWAGIGVAVLILAVVLIVIFKK